MADRPLSDEVRDRIYELARKRNEVRQIAERLGLSACRVRSVLRRAEENGVIPSGNLTACTPRRHRAAAFPATPAEKSPIRVWVPARSQAAKYGKCAANCKTTTDVIVEIGDVSFSLCKLHVPVLVDQLELAIANDKKLRIAFGGGRV